MKTIYISSCGDQWLNREQLTEELRHTHPTVPVVFDTRHEGISLKGLGVLEVITQWHLDTFRSADSIKINSPNRYEITPYENIYADSFNQFFPAAKKYQIPKTPITPNSKLFGYFVGRYTYERNLMAMDILSNYKEHFLMSVMHSEKYDPIEWWHKDVAAVGSLDNLTLYDQTDMGAKTIPSLLSYYDQFQIELVAETMTVGETFFPTEKTIRAIVGCRPFLIYGPNNYLNNLQKLGFQTYDKLWLETYDWYDGVSRWRQIQQIVRHVINYGYDINQAQEIANFNYDHLFTLISNDMRFLDDITNI